MLRKFLGGWMGGIIVIGLVVAAEFFGSNAMLRKVLWWGMGIVAVLTAWVNG